MKAILHIGTEKTGTTSFQRFCHDNRQILIEYGIYYPEKLGGYNHRYLSTYCLDFSTIDDTRASLNINSPMDMESFYSDVIRKWEDQLAKYGNVSTWLISSEHFHSRLKKTTQVERIYKLLIEKFDEIEVIVHLRPQIDVAISLASTMTRVGSIVNKKIFENVDIDSIYYNYLNLVSIWEEVFGVDRITCVPFKSHPDFTKFIFSKLDIDISSLPAPVRYNEALDVGVIAIVNGLIEAQEGVRIDPKLLDKVPVRNKIEIGKELAHSFQYKFQSSNQKLIFDRNDLKSGDLQPDWSRYNGEANIDVLDIDQELVGALSDLVKLYNAAVRSK